MAQDAGYLEYPAAPHEVTMPIRFAEFVDGDILTTGRRVDELMSPDIDTDMGDPVSTCTEKDQVTGV
jgi:hypothetical protein